MTSSYETNDRNWAINANAAGLLSFTNIPLLAAIVTALIVVKVQKEGAPLATQHARSAFNFQATFILFQLLLVGLAIARPTLLVQVAVTYIVLLILNGVACIWGCARASDLRPFTYPLAIPFLR